MEIGRSHNVGVPRMLTGVKGAKELDQVSKEVAADSAAVVQDALEPSVQKAMASDVQKLRSAFQGRGLAPGQMKTALMMAGALISGPTGVMPYSMADRLNTAMASRETRDELVDQAVELSQGGKGLQDAQMQSMGVRVTRALVDEKVEGSNVPTALFMSGAIRHHQAGQ